MATATMQLEIDVATNFLLSFAYSKLPRAQADAFKRELTRTLLNLYSGHWYPNNPNRGSAYRSLSVNDRIDPSIQTAAESSGINTIKLREHLPKNMTMWIDPYEVSYRIGERGEITTLWQQQKQTSNRANSNHRAGQYRSKFESPRAQRQWFQAVGDQEAEVFVGSPNRNSPTWSQWSTASSDMAEPAGPSSPYGRTSAFSDSQCSSPSSSGSPYSSDDEGDVLSLGQHRYRQPFYVTYRGEVYNAKALGGGYSMASGRSASHSEQFYASPRREVAVNS